jgi:HK97 family phage prohead protease
MPYYIQQGCGDKPDYWGVYAVDTDTTYGCHATKQDAIDQALAISLSDDEPFLGERSVRDMPDLTPPMFMQEAAKQGLKYHAEGLSGDGVRPRTIREARLMASGQVSADKWVRIAAWIARHLVDLDAPAADPSNDDYPSAGVVAHLLWGSGPSKDAANRAMEYAQRLVARIEEEQANRYIETQSVSNIGDNSNMNIRAEAGELSVGDYVSWDSAGGTARGEIIRIVTEGTLSVPDTDFTLNATPEDPAALIQIYRESGDGYEDTDVIVGHRFSTLTKIDELESPSDDDEDEDASRSRNVFETRVQVADFELRETPDGMLFEGYAAVFNSRSENLGGFTEFVAPGAFTRSLKTRNDVKLLWNHDTSMVLGSTRARTLTLTEDNKGLRVSAKLPNTSAGRDAAELLKRGDVDAMSFGFTVLKDSWNGEGNERTLNAVRLHEVSIVAFPAYTATAGTATVRSLEALATRTEADPEALELALNKLEAGEDLDNDARNLLSSVIDKLSPSHKFDPKPEDNVVGDLGLLALKKKKITLLEL